MSRKQTARIIEALGLNPSYSQGGGGFKRATAAATNNRRKHVDPNIVYIDIECAGDKA